MSKIEKNRLGKEIDKLRCMGASELLLELLENIRDGVYMHREEIKKLIPKPLQKYSKDKEKYANEIGFDTAIHAVNTNLFGDTKPLKEICGKLKTKKPISLKAIKNSKHGG